MSASEIYSPAEEEAAFGAVYAEHHQKLLRYCQYRLRDRHEAEDVMQEAFVRAWRSMPANAYGTNFYPWLRVVAGNLCTDVLRKRSRSEPMAEVEPGVVDGGMDRITEEEDRALVRQALLRLNDRHRDALIMRESEGLTYDQIAARTGATSATVESLLWRARQALKREFTVISGRTGAMAPMPFLAGIAARAAAARRRLGARLSRRLPGVNRLLTDNPNSHLMLAAITALTVVGGIAATFNAGRAPANTPAVATVTTPSLARATATTAGAAASATSIVASTAARASAAASAASGTASSATVAGETAQVTHTPSLASARLVDPVATGSVAAHTAYKAPVGVNLYNDVAVGVFPTTATKFVNDGSTAVRNSADQAVAAVIKPSK